MNLVQRLRRTSQERDAKGVDRFFAMDYMGRAEFECGALSASLKVFLKQTNMLWKFTRFDTPFFFVGPADEIQQASALVDSEIGEKTIRLKEPTNMRRSVAGEKHVKDIVGWWWLSQDSWPDAEDAKQPTWAIFLNEQDADKWLLGVNQK